jgi:hypothetical protein
MKTALFWAVTQQEVVIQDDQKVSVHLMITIHVQKFTRIVQSVPRHSPDMYCRLTITPSVIPNYNYVIMVSD